MGAIDEKMKEMNKWGQHTTQQQQQQQHDLSLYTRLKETAKK